jgi:hypothetical protein
MTCVFDDENRQEVMGTWSVLLVLQFPSASDDGNEVCEEGGLGCRV